MHEDTVAGLDRAAMLERTESGAARHTNAGALLEGDVVWERVDVGGVAQRVLAIGAGGALQRVNPVADGDGSGVNPGAECGDNASAVVARREWRFWEQVRRRAPRSGRPQTLVRVAAGGRNGRGGK